MEAVVADAAAATESRKRFIGRLQVRRACNAPLDARVGKDRTKVAGIKK